VCTIAAASHPLRGVAWHSTCCRLPSPRSSHTPHNVIMVVMSRPPSLWNSCFAALFVTSSLSDFCLTFVWHSLDFRPMFVRLSFDFRLTFVGWKKFVQCSLNSRISFDVCRISIQWFLSTDFRPMTFIHHDSYPIPYSTNHI